MHNTVIQGVFLTFKSIMFFYFIDITKMIVLAVVSLDVLGKMKPQPTKSIKLLRQAGY